MKNEQKKNVFKKDHVQNGKIKYVKYTVIY